MFPAFNYLFRCVRADGSMVCRAHSSQLALQQHMAQLQDRKGAQGKWPGVVPQESRFTHFFCIRMVFLASQHSHMKSNHLHRTQLSPQLRHAVLSFGFPETEQKLGWKFPARLRTALRLAQQSPAATRCWPGCCLCQHPCVTVGIGRAIQASTAPPCLYRTGQSSMALPQFLSAASAEKGTY